MTSMKVVNLEINEMEHEEIIARANILNATTGRAKFWHKAIAKEHQYSCKRFLEFLNENLIEDSDILDFRNENTKEVFSDKMKELEQAIKLYEVPISDEVRT